MGISGFPFLGITLNLEDPAYSEHISSVYLFSSRVCERNWSLCIVSLQFLNYSLYWSPGTIQWLSSLDQVKQFILAYRSVPGQGTKELSYSLYNFPHRGESIFSKDPSTFSDHLTTTMVDSPPSWAWLLIITPYGAKSSIRIDSWFSSSDKKPWTDWFPIGDNHYSKSWSSLPWYWNSPSIRFGGFNYLLIESFQHRSVENALTTQFPCK